MEILKENKVTDRFLLHRKQLLAQIYSAQELFFKNLESIPEYYSLTTYTIVTNNEVKLSIIVFNNPDLIYNNKKAIALGCFESVDDVQYLKKVVSEIKNDFPKKIIIGPLNGSTWESYRFNLNIDNPPFFTEQELKQYYPQLFLQVGFKQIANYESTILRDYNFDTHNLKVLTEKFSQIVNFRKADLNNLESEFENVYPLVIESFADNLFYTPLSKDLFIKKYAALKNYYDSDYMIVATDNKTNELVGFILGLPDHLNKSEKGMIVKTLARTNDIKYKGIGSVLTLMLTNEAINKKCDYIIHAYMHVDNASTGVSDKFNSKPYRTYGVYII